MHSTTQTAIVIDEYGAKPQLKTDFPIPEIQDGELLVKVEASTINPSDRIFMAGHYFKKPLPAICGLEGTGTVVEAKGEAVQSWVGKRVCFTTRSGSWCEYAAVTPFTCFELDKEVSVSSAASGIVNPLTVVGFVENFKTLGRKGIIHTAAASALGRMLNKLCLKEKIPLLNIVRKQEQADLLKKEGATHILITTGDWEKELKELIEKEGFDCLYDALGGGPVTEAIITSLKSNSIAHVYGVLEGKPFHLSNSSIFFSGLTITGFLLLPWWISVKNEEREKIRSQYSSLLKNELLTNLYKEYSLKDIDEAIEVSVSKSNEGKVLLKIA